MNSARRLSVLFAALVAVSVTGSSLAQTSDIQIKVRDALYYYLNVDCLVGEKRKPLGELIELQKLPGVDFKESVEDRLTQLLKEGPEMQQTLESLQPSLDRQWTEREAYLQTVNARRGLKDQEVQLLQRVTKKEYMDQQRKRLIRKYRGRAAIALAAIGSKTASATLSEVAVTADKDLQRTIRSAMERFPRSR